MKIKSPQFNNSLLKVINFKTNSTEMEFKTKPKVAIFHHFLKGDCKGGGEKLILQMREYYEADLWVGGVDLAVWGKQNKAKDHDFVGKVWDSRFKFFYLHEESSIPIWRHIKRQLFFAFSPRIRALLDYDLVIFSFGNIAFVPQRLAKMKKQQKLTQD